MPTTKNQIKRKIYIDNIKRITVVIVVIYHVFFMYNWIDNTITIGPLSDYQPRDRYLYIVYPWFMLLLFVISWMCSKFYLENHSDKEFIKSRTLKLLVPSTIWLFIFQWILWYFNTQIVWWFDRLNWMPIFIKYLFYVISGQWPLWYIQLLWLFSMILLLIRKIEKNRLEKICKKTNIIVLILFAVLIYLSAQILNMPYVIVFRFGIYWLWFLLWYFVFSHDKVIERLEKYRLPLWIWAIILAITFITMHWWQNYTAHEVLDTFICNIYAWITVLAIFAFMKNFCEFENKFTKWMNSKSRWLFIFHYLFITICAYYLQKYLPNIPIIFTYLITIMIWFGWSYITYETIKRIPFLRWCILWIKKDIKIKK